MKNTIYGGSSKKQKTWNPISGGRDGWGAHEVPGSPPSCVPLPSTPSWLHSKPLHPTWMVSHIHDSCQGYSNPKSAPSIGSRIDIIQFSQHEKIQVSNSSKEVKQEKFTGLLHSDITAKGLLPAPTEFMQWSPLKGAWSSLAIKSDYKGRGCCSSS